MFAGVMLPSLSQIRDVVFSEETCKQYLLEHGVFYEGMSCPVCGTDMSRSVGRWSFRCNKKGCRKEITMSKDTFFEDCRLKEKY